MQAIERRVVWTTFGVLVVWAALAWALTARTASSMSGMVMGLAQVGSRMPPALSALVFGGMWLAMMIAMMFPTMGPMVAAHRMVTRRRGEGLTSTVAFVGGYLVVWTLAGAVPFVVLLALSRLPHGAAAPWIPGTAAAVLIAAGLYQFTPLKTICLRACRTPLGFILTHDFRSGAPGALRAGMLHGAFCLGCCWALMAILVVLGLMNLIWMVALSAVFLLEKNWRGGVVLSRVVGVALVVLGIVVFVRPQALSALSGSATPPQPDSMSTMKM